MSSELAHQSHSKRNSLSSEFLEWLKATVGGEREVEITDTFAPSGFSNKIVRLTFDDGQKVIIKQSQYDWATPRFHSAKRASELLRQQSLIKAPEHISIPKEVVDTPTLVYRYLPFPTLKELWPKLSFSQRKQASKNLGRMLRKMHQINVRGYGLLDEEHSYSTVSSFMYSDLRDRLKSAIAAKWPDVLPLVNRLMDMAKNLPDKNKEASLVHNDMHLGNILCEIEDNKIECIGLIDLEEASGGRWESDLASAITLHHPLFFSGEKNGRWLKEFGRFITEGYGQKPDQHFLRFFRAYHLINLGFFSAMNGEDEHASRVGEKVYEVLNDK